MIGVDEDDLQVQERAVLRLLCKGGMMVSEIADELSKDRLDDPLSEQVIHTYISRLRKRGVRVVKRTVYGVPRATSADVARLARAEAAPKWWVNNPKARALP